MRIFPSRLLVPEIVLLVLFAVLLCQSHWTGSFAFEFSFFLGGFSFLVSSVGTLLRFHGLPQDQRETPRKVWKALGASLLTLVFPLLVVLAYGLKIPTCRYEVGLAWFFLLPVISTLWGCGCAFWALGFLRSRIVSLFLLFLLPLAFSLWTLWDLYTQPSLSFLHPVLGYFPGPLYDEWIPLDLKIWTYRFWVLLFSLWLSFWRIPSFKKGWIVGLLLLSVLFFREPLGWIHSTEKLQGSFPKVKKEKLFSVYYSPTTFQSLEINHLSRILEFHIQTLSRELQLVPEKISPISIYLFSSLEEKRKFTGTQHTSVGNPIQRTLLLLESDLWSPIFRHELTHVVAGDFGVPWLKLSLRIGLLEGLATAMEGYRGPFSLHEWARAMQIHKLLPPMKSLFEFSGFWEQSPMNAYLASGSFCRWLIDNKGIQNFKKIYIGHSFKKTYGQTLEEILSEWEIFIQAIPLSPQSLPLAKSHLIHLPIQKRRCPHDVAAAQQKSMECLNQRRETCWLQYTQQAWNYSGRAIPQTLRLVRTYLQLNQGEEGRKLLEQNKNRKNLTPDQQIWMNLYQADLDFMMGNLQKAQTQWKMTLANSSSISSFLEWALGLRIYFAQQKEFSSLQKIISKGFSKKDWNHLPPLPFPVLEKKRLLEKARREELLTNWPSANKIYQTLGNDAQTEGEKFFWKEQLNRIYFCKRFSTKVRRS